MRVLILLACLLLVVVGPVSAVNLTSFLTTETTYTVAPYAFYDPTTGFQVGAIGLTKNYFKKNESLGLAFTLVQNGGRDLTFTSSWPDKDIRYRTSYPLGVDFNLSGGKAVGDRFYGFGSGTPAQNYSYYNNGYYNGDLTFNNSLRDNFVIKYGLKYSANGFSDIKQGVNPVTPAIQAATALYYAGNVGFEVNNTDNGVHPHKGEDLMLNYSFGVNALGSQASYSRIKMSLAKFISPFSPDHILAGKISLDNVVGTSIPLYEYPMLGGKDTLRGYPTYRFRGDRSALLNLEYRFPLVLALGGVLFVDTGQTFQGADGLTLTDWPLNYGLGLRLFLANIILRMDYGISKEGGFLYLFYDHMF